MRQVQPGPWLDPGPRAASRLRLPRRCLLAAAAALLAARPAAALVPTPRQTEGPFYPESFPLDSDSDLVQVAGQGERAKGTILYISGRVLDASGRAIADARVEIWQADHQGRYHHPRDRAGADPAFQGYGRAESDGNGTYRFRTIRPVPYTGRTQHIHFALAGPGFERFVTQMYVAGEPGNARDPILNGIRDEAARNSVIVELTPAPELETGALHARFDIVLGHNAVQPA